MNIERFAADPKVITERVVGEPRVITDKLLEPTRQRVVIQPQINETKEKFVPVFQRQQQQIQTRNEELPIKYDTK